MITPGPPAHDPGDARKVDLVEANEQLVLAALHAQTIAENAASELQALARASQRDALTNTPNRAQTLDRISRSIALARRKGTRIAVLFADIDHFKEVNDTFGHAAGDQALQLVAQRLEAAVRESDTVGRHGGDEFLVLLNEISNASDATVIAAKMRDSIADSASVDGHAVTLSLSIGVAVYPEDGEDADSLIRCADAAMYRAKHGSVGIEARCAPANASDERSNWRARRRVMPPHAEALTENARPIGELREANEELVLAALSAQELQEVAEAALHREIASLATLAHELRHPLTPILTAAALLKRICIEDAQLAGVPSIIERQANHLARLVDDLLDRSRVGTGKFRLDRGNVDMTKVLEQAVETCRPAMDGRLQHFQMQLPAVPLLVRGDPVRLVQIFVNLLRNSCKYTPERGSISVRASVHANELEVVVSDTGIGIAPEALPHIFDLFAQDARGLVVSKDGLGIGLAVVRELVQAHSGTVTARNADSGPGCIFVVTLPLLGALAAA
jgi:diguanylate cyclase (GGDEF)-like protein